MTVKSEWALVRFDTDTETGDVSIGPSSQVTPSTSCISLVPAGVFVFTRTMGGLLAIC